MIIDPQDSKLPPTRDWQKRDARFRSTIDNFTVYADCRGYSLTRDDGFATKAGGFAAPHTNYQRAVLALQLLQEEASLRVDAEVLEEVAA